MYLVGLEPKPVVGSGIRRRPAPATASTRENEAPQSSTSEPVVPSPAVAKGAVEPARPEVFNFRFAADRGFREKLERLGEVLGIDGGERRMAEVIEYALDCALDRKDPARRLERRRGAGYRCEFEGPDGRRCTARAGLTIEHVDPKTVTSGCG